MKRILILLALAIASVSHAQTILTNTSVIKMSKSKLDDDIIMTTVNASDGKYDITPDGLTSLKSAGVSSAVIKSLITKMQGKENKTGITGNGTTIGPPVRTPEPESLNAVYNYNKNGKSLKALERANGLLKAKIGALGMGGTSNNCEISGNKSPVRLSLDEASSFLINTGAASPEALHLYKLKSSKKARWATLSKTSALAKSSGAEGTIACQIKTVKPGVFEITTDTKLAVGEYFFIVKEVSYTSSLNVDVYAFGID